MTALSALVQLAALSGVFAVGWRVTRFVLAPPAVRWSMLQALWVRVTWRRLARVVGLVYRDPNPTWRPWIWRRADPHDDEPHVVVPRIRLRTDPFGVIVLTRPLPRVGRAEWEAAAPSLAASWRCARVGVSESRRGRLVIRGVRRDPLTIPTAWRPTDRNRSVDVWPIGVDEYAQPVKLPLRDVAGVTVAGLPGSGKTSLLAAFLARYAPSPSVQFVVMDGKGSVEYDDVRPRLSAFVDDDLEAANQLLTKLVDLRRQRARVTRNFWQSGPSIGTPLVVVVVDEAHTFFADLKGSDPHTRTLAALTAENRRLTEDLTKKGRSSGFLTILATQRATFDSIPTSIRDTCTIGMSFAQSTSAASVAALGESIREWPSADPMALQGPQYVGVASMRVEGRPGFTRVRTPYVPDELVRTICADSAHLARPLTELHPRPLAVVQSVDLAA